MQGRAIKRCAWVHDNALEIAYHDEEWGVPSYDDRRLFEFLILEGAQAGLSWSTILNKRNHYRAAFDGFEPEIVASYGTHKVYSLLRNPGIVRNRLKIASAINNAQRFLAVQSECGSFANYLWTFTAHRPIQNRWRQLQDVPASTQVSDMLSRDLKRRGFKFVGSTICYAYMQAVGLVNDHTTDCFRYREVQRLQPTQ